MQMRDAMKIELASTAGIDLFSIAILTPPPQDPYGTPATSTSKMSVESTPGPAFRTEMQIPATPVTDFSMLEAQKENIRPLSTGRSASTLSNIFSKERAEAERTLQLGHDSHQRAIETANQREAEGEEMEDGIMDVLDPYVKYVELETNL